MATNYRTPLIQRFVSPNERWEHTHKSGQWPYSPLLGLCESFIGSARGWPCPWLCATGGPWLCPLTVERLKLECLPLRLKDPTSCLPKMRHVSGVIDVWKGVPQTYHRSKPSRSPTCQRCLLAFRSRLAGLRRCRLQRKRCRCRCLRCRGRLCGLSGS